MELNYREGELLLINKPYTWSSFQAVNKLKHALKKHPSLLLDEKFVHLKMVKIFILNLLQIDLSLREGLKSHFQP